MDGNLLVKSHVIVVEPAQFVSLSLHKFAFLNKQICDATYCLNFVFIVTEEVFVILDENVLGISFEKARREEIHIAKRNRDNFVLASCPVCIELYLRIGALRNFYIHLTLVPRKRINLDLMLKFVNW